MTEYNFDETRRRTGQRRARPFLQPLAVALVCLVVVCLFLILGMLDVRRVEDVLLNVLENKGLTIIEGVERLTQEKFNLLKGVNSNSFRLPGEVSGLDAVFSLRESLAGHLINLARDIDLKEKGGLLNKEKLQDLAIEESLEGIVLVNGKGSVIYQSGSFQRAILARARPLLEGTEEVFIDLYGSRGESASTALVGLRRKTGSGTILLVLDNEGLRYWQSRVAAQEAIEEAGWREGVTYFAVTDGRGRFLAGAGELPAAKAGEKEQLSVDGDPGPEMEGSRRLSTGSLNLLEVSAFLRLDGGIVGMARVGLDTSRVDRLLERNRSHIFLTVGLVVGAGLLAIWFLYRIQNRHLARIQDMRDRLQRAERLSSLGHLAAGVAHEIRNPLNAIGMAIQRIQREHRPAEEENYTEFHQLTMVVREEINRLNGIIEDFLSLSRRRHSGYQPQSIKDLIEKIILLLGEEASSRSVSIHSRWQDPVATIYLDADKMQQALLNLLKNALESISGSGAVTVTVGPYKKNWVSIKIVDTGAGIPPERVEQVFGPHYTTKEKGFGLGLPIAYQIIRAHGGEMQIQSEPGKGTTVEVMLPREEYRGGHGEVIP